MHAGEERGEIGVAEGELRNRVGGGLDLVAAAALGDVDTDGENTSGAVELDEIGVKDEGMDRAGLAAKLRREIADDTGGGDAADELFALRRH